MPTTEPAPLLHPNLPTPPEGTAWTCETRAETGRAETLWYLHNRGATPDTVAYTWLISVTGLDNPTVKSAVLSDWYGRDTDQLQRDVKVTFVDGSRAVAYETKPNPAAPGKRLAALDRIAARLAQVAWPATGGGVVFTFAPTVCQDIAAELRAVGYTIDASGTAPMVDDNHDTDDTPNTSVVDCAS